MLIAESITVQMVIPHVFIVEGVRYPNPLNTSLFTYPYDKNIETSLICSRTGNDYVDVYNQAQHMAMVNI